MSYIRNKWEELDELNEFKTETTGKLMLMPIKKYPRLFTKGVSGHGYGGDNGGMGNMDRLTLSSETVSKIGWGSSSRHYPGMGQSNDFNYGFTYGSLNTASTDVDGSPAETNKGFARFNMSNETETEVDFNIGEINKIVRCVFNEKPYSYLFRSEMKVRKHTFSNDASTEMNMFTVIADFHNGTFSDFYGDGYVTSSSEVNKDLYKINFANDTHSVCNSSSLQMDYDGGTVGYGTKTLVNTGGNGGAVENRAQHHYYFSNDVYASTGNLYLYIGGETQQSAGNYFNYNLGSYGVGTQTSYSEKTNQESGISVAIPNSTYPLSSGVNYIV